MRRFRTALCFTLLLAAGLRATPGVEQPVSPSAKATPAGEPIRVREQNLFTSGEGGYDTYRIPALVRTNSGRLLAFAEGRKAGRSDHGKIDLLMRASDDSGQTWGPVSLLWEDGDNTCGNPTPIVERESGKVLLLATWNKGSDTEKLILAGEPEDSRRVFLLTSGDEGQTWSEAREITDSVKKPNWRWYATGPCHAIQTRNGRIIVPANHSDENVTEAFDHYRSHFIYSDDAGETWNIGAIAAPRTNEATVAELADGRIVLNMRSYENIHRRAVAFSEDGGETLGKTWLDPQLIEARCQASILPVTHLGREHVLFANAADTTRNRMTIKWSGDGMKTWNPGLLVYPGSSAYCDLAQVDDSTLALISERDDYARIVLTLVPLDGLLGASEAYATEDSRQADPNEM